MTYFNVSLLSIAWFLSVTSLYLIFRSQKTNAAPNKLLSVWLLGLGALMLMLYLIQSKYLLLVPWLYRVPSPLYYLVFPAGFLYTRMTLNNETKLNNMDWLHFLPGILHFFEYIPYYLLPINEKIKIIEGALTLKNNLLTHHEGFLPPYLHNIIRGIQGLIYGSIILWMVLNRKQKVSLKTAHDILIHRWFTFIGAIQILYAFILLFVYPNESVSGEIKITIICVAFAVSFIYIAVQLIYNPSVLMGLPLQVVVSDTEINTTFQKERKVEPKRNELKSSVEEWQGELKTVLDYLEFEKPFLRPEYRLSDLAKDVNIPTHRLSYIFNHLLNSSFNDFLNERRIAQFKRLASEQKSKSYTLEALATQSGFGSRSSFIRITKKLTGENPSSFLKKGVNPMADEV